MSVPLAKLVKISRAAHRLYVIKPQPKKGGGTRIIEVPFDSLKAIQQKLHDELLSDLPVHEALYGRANTSHLMAARVHVRQPMVVTMDITNFFPSVTNKMILQRLSQVGFQRETAELVTRLCTRKKRLPQGAPTSPAIGRLVVSPLIDRIDRLLASISPHCRVTQFVDDLAMSGPTGIFRSIPTIHKIWNDNGFKVNPAKTLIMASAEPQEILGVWVNMRVEPSARFLERLALAKATLPSNDPHRRGLEAYHRSILRTGRD